jgi:predicted DNA-binding protein
VEDRLTEFVSARLTKTEKQQADAVSVLTGKTTAQLLREAFNSVVSKYLKVVE